MFRRDCVARRVGRCGASLSGRLLHRGPAMRISRRTRYDDRKQRGPTLSAYTEGREDMLVGVRVNRVD